MDALNDICANPAFYELFGGFTKIECCTGNLCNAGSPYGAPPATMTTSGGIVVPVTSLPAMVHCWVCQGNLTADGRMPTGDSTCGDNDLIWTADDAYTGICATGSCIVSVFNFFLSNSHYFES